MLKKNRKKNKKNHPQNIKILIGYMHFERIIKTIRLIEKTLRLCWLCTGNHKISNCQKLKNESIENRRSLKKKKKLCFNCLSNTHMINTCKCKRHCQVDNCQKRYHTLLHSEGMRVPNSPDQIDSNINNIIEKEILSQTYL